MTVRVSGINTETGRPVLFIGLTYAELGDLIEKVLMFSTADLQMPDIEVWLIAAETREGIMELLPQRRVDPPGGG